jgi:nickel-dependent lactate racemase
MLLPGVAGQETVTSMHLLGATEQQLGNVDTPCRQEMEDFAKEVGLHFIVNVLNDTDGNVLKVVAGHFIKAHRRGIELGKEIYGAPYDGRADITLSSTYPCGDFDLTQADKGLFSAELATEQGGEIILLSPCPEGIAPTHGDEMAKLARYSDDELWKMLENDQIHDRFCASECMYLNHIKTHFKGTLMMDPMLTNMMGFHYLGADDLQGYIDYKLKLEPDLKIGIIRKSSEVLPIEKKDR